MKKTPLLTFILFSSLLACEVQAGSASQDFEGWGLPVEPGTYTNSEWIVSDGLFHPTFYHSPSRGVVLQNDGDYTNGFIRTPLLTNGFGTVSVWAQNRNTSSIEFEVLTSPDGINWTSFSTVTNTGSGTWNQHDIVVNSQANGFVKLFKSEATANGQWLVFDDVSITEPPAIVTFSDVVTDPEMPMTNDPVWVSCVITPSALASNVSATLHYTVGLSSNSIGMVTNESLNGYTTTTAIPEQPGEQRVDYTITATYDGAAGVNTSDYSSAYLTCSLLTNSPFQDFEGWGLTITPGTYTNGGWIVSDGMLHPTSYSPDRGGALINTDGTYTNGFIRSPCIANGFGTVSVWATNRNTSSIEFEVLTSPDGINWTTFSTVTNTGSDWNQHDIVVNSQTHGYVKLFKSQATANGQWLVFDDISITVPPAVVAFSDVITDPAVPMLNDPVWVSATITPSILASNVSATLHYTVGLSSNSIGMVTNASLNGYTTTSAIPGQPAGQRVDYTVTATFDGPSAFSPSNYVSSYTAQERAFLSEHSELTLIEDIAGELLTINDYQWRGFLDISTPLVDADFKFQGITTNAPPQTNQWGDSDQTFTELPVVGTANPGGSSISVDSLPAGQYIIGFNETNLYYTLKQGYHEEFEDWSGSGFGTYTNDGWIATDALIESPADPNRERHGKMCVLESNGLANVRSPLLENGIGTISFWYRNWETDGQPDTELYLQVSQTGGTSPDEWNTLETISGITIATYLRTEIEIHDPYSQYFRIVIGTNSTNARICIDDIAVTDFAPGIVVSNILTSPTAPTTRQEVNVSCSISPSSYATNVLATLWYGADNGRGVYDSISMSRTGTVEYATDTPIPYGPAGLMNYFIEVSFLDEMDNETITTFAPAGGSSHPLSYTNTEVLNGFQDFEGWGLSAVPGTYTNSEWIVSDGQLGVVYVHSPSHGMVLRNDGTYTNGFVQTPVFTNGVSSIYFWAYNKDIINIGFELQVSSNGTDWTTHSTITNTEDGVWNQHAVTINNPNPVSLRLFKSQKTDNGQWLVFDDIAISLPPAFVEISSPTISPPYPSVSDSVDVFSTITFGNGPSPAINIQGTLHYRYGSVGDFTAIPMERTGNNFVTSTGIPAAPAGTIIEYYIESAFAGYAYGDEDRSPMVYPSVGAAAPLSYTIRQNASDYSSVHALVNGEALGMRPYDDNKWQGVISFPTNVLNPLITVEGLGYNDGSGYSETPVSWGDSSQTSSNLPLLGAMQIGGATIELDGTYRGQYVLRFDEETLEYILVPCTFNDFDTWPTLDVFEESRDAINKGHHDEDFDDWVLSVPNSRGSDFEGGWPLASDYPPDPSDFGSDRGDGDYWAWFIENAALIPQSLDSPGFFMHALELIDTPNLGVVRLEKDGPLDGIGTVSFKYRCANHDRPVTVYANSIGWTNTAVTVRLRATETAPGAYSWLSVYPRYVDADNFYELRIQPSELSLYRTKSGVETPVVTNIATQSSITTPTSYRICIDNHSVAGKIEFIVYDGDTVLFEYADDMGSGVADPGYVAISSLDASVAVEEVTGGPGVMQSFAGWPDVSNDDAITTRDDWTAARCQITSTQAQLSKYNATKSPALSNLQAPKLPHGIGTIHFRAKKTDNDKEADLLLQYSDTGGTNSAEWTTFDTKQIPLTEYTQLKSEKHFTNSYFRFANTNHLQETPDYILIDGIAIEPATNSPAYLEEDFQDSMAQGWSDGVGAWGLTTNHAYYPGINVYFMEGYYSDPLSFAIQTASSTNYDYLGSDSSWSTETTHTGLYNTAYNQYSYAVNNADAAYARVKHTTGEGHLIIDNITNESWHGETILNDGWMASAAWVIGPETNKYTNSIELTNTRMASVEDQAIRSPYLEEGCGIIKFDYRNLSTITSAVFAVERTNIGDTNSWNEASPVALITNLTPAANMNLATGWTNISIAVDAGDPMFVRIRQVSTHEDAGILIDDVTISEQVATNEFTWFAYNGLISDQQTNRLLWEQSVNKQGAYLNHIYGPTNDTPEMLGDDMPYIQTGYLSNGIGRINFHYRAWEPSESATLVLRMAPSRETPKHEWITLQTISLTNDVFAVFDEDFYSQSNHYVRIYTEITNGSARACIDNAMVMAPIGAYLNIRDLTISPELPLAGDLVTVRAVVTNFFLNPSNITMTTYYHTNTAEWGSFDNAWERQMSIVESNGNFIAFETTVPLPTQKIDTVVQYAVAASYDGRWSDVSSPKESREFTTPQWHYPADLNAGKAQSVPHYVVFSCGTNDVWINELNRLSLFGGETEEYIELCGRADVNIGNWTVEVFPESYTTQALYSIASGTSFEAETNGFGFWVLGNSSTATRDMLLSGVLPDTGGIRLMRSMGALVDAVCYDRLGEAGHPLLSDPSYGFRDIGTDSMFVSAPLGLVGTGDESSDFEWVNNTGNSYSPGVINFGQVLQGSNPVAPFTSSITISNLWTDASTIYMNVMADTNTLVPTPWYTTNLLRGVGWVEGSNATYTHTGHTYTVWFDRVTDVPYCFYRITATNSP